MFVFFVFGRGVASMRLCISLLQDFTAQLPLRLLKKYGSSKLSSDLSFFAVIAILQLSFFCHYALLIITQKKTGTKHKVSVALASSPVSLSPCCHCCRYMWHGLPQTPPAFCEDQDTKCRQQSLNIVECDPCQESICTDQHAGCFLQRQQAIRIPR